MTVLKTRIGPLAIEEDAMGLCAVRPACGEACGQASTPLLAEAGRQIQAYLSGTLRTFDLPLSMHGSDFDRSVWAMLRTIPYGEQRTYGEVAALLGRATAARAVGGACSRNPLLIVVPCHRVIGSTGKLTGFAAGLTVKQALLALEGASRFARA